MSCPILLSSALVVSSLRQRARGKQSHIQEMGHNLDATVLVYIELIGGLTLPTKKELAAARALKKRNQRAKARWDRMEREESTRRW